jgi:hypothetical protein
MSISSGTNKKLNFRETIPLKSTYFALYFAPAGKHTAVIIMKKMSYTCRIANKEANTNTSSNNRGAVQRSCQILKILVTHLFKVDPDVYCE